MRSLDPFPALRRCAGEFISSFPSARERIHQHQYANGNTWKQLMLGLRGNRVRESQQQQQQQCDAAILRLVVVGAGSGSGSGAGAGAGASSSGSKGEPSKSSSPSNFPLDWDPFEDMFGLGVDLRSRKNASADKTRRGRELDGSSTKETEEIACPTCEGQGYLPCPRCKSTNLEPSCPQCFGRGNYPCPVCKGQRVIVEEDPLASSAWASQHSRTPMQIAEDEAIESIASSPAPKRKTGRVYRPPRPETREKISRALKELEARTGSLSEKVRGHHRDPILRAQRTAAIKRSRGTDEARKRSSEKLKEYFKSAENRLKRSESMKGVRYRCSACGEEGHRKHYCPKLGFKTKQAGTNHSTDSGQVGPERAEHLRIPEVTPSHVVGKVSSKFSEIRAMSGEKGQTKKARQCGVCHRPGHTKRTCPTLRRPKRHCSICGQSGHNRQNCPVAADKSSRT